MKKFFMWFWGNKQMVTSALTTTIASFGTADIISATLANKITVVTAALMTLFALAYTYFMPQPPSAPPAP